MLENPWVVALATIALIVASAFFVVIEFALLGARRYRLEEDAAGSRSARAALRGVNELTMMLAVAQLGITACTFALGAVTKPAVDAALSPLFLGLGLPDAAADVTAFLLSLLVVTFLHLVVGEMAPKSWAIAHPELAAKAIGPAAQVIAWPLRPVLSWINRMANRLVAATGVTPVDRAAVGGRDVETIRQLVEHSASSGTLEESVRSPLAAAIDLSTREVGTLVEGLGAPTMVGAGATAAEVQRAAAESGHLRILIRSERAAAPRIVHVRDTLALAPGDAVRDLARDAFVLDGGTPVHEALASMRRASEQLAVVAEGEQLRGVVSVQDLLRSVLPAGAVG